MSEPEIIKTDDVELGTEKIISTTNSQKRPSIIDQIKEKTKDQDFQQRMNVASTLLLEIYRVLMGAFLVIFVPQKCGENICSLSENINREDGLAKTAIGFNAITMFTFLMLYFVEVKRENKLINYLEVNRFTPVDNDSVGEALQKLATEKKQSIWNYDGYYQTAGYISTGSFILNAIFSSIVIMSHYFDSKTITVLLTNLLFMGLKVSDVYSTVNTKKNVFYSAYLKNKVQFNDVDPDKIMIQSSQVEELHEDIVSIEDGKEQESVQDEERQSESIKKEEDVKEDETTLIEDKKEEDVKEDETTLIEDKKEEDVKEEETTLIEERKEEDVKEEETTLIEERKEEEIFIEVNDTETGSNTIEENKPLIQAQEEIISVEEESKEETLGPEDLV
jgi:hypothetical protein